MIKFLAKRIKWIIVGVGVLFFWLTQTEWLQTVNLWQVEENKFIDNRFRLRDEKET